ncbi:hypothetical protein [Mucilaginibacter antarcticus]|uniref:hypothetical protein n=1 Tax=Mucilaginibacter antarcticus TaxID=1855725 RepID=UPI00363CF08B
MKKLILCLLLLLAASTGRAHVGSPGVTFEGNAGPYKLLVNITPPDVIPGTAAVTVFLEDALQGVQISAKPVYWSVGADGTPQADAATPSVTQPGAYEVKIWFMSVGTSSIEVIVNGPKGKASVIVPVMAVSTAKRSMPAGLGWGLFAMAVFLVVLMVTIISASTGDSQLSPGQQMDKPLRVRRFIGGLSGLVILMLILWGGWSWWTAAANNYNRYLYQPIQATTKVDAQTGVLTLSVDGNQLANIAQNWRMSVSRKMNYVVPDHGKLMHLFLIKAGDLDVFAHLHPRRVDSVTFVAKVPDMPAGRYFVYADITRLSGFAETIVDTLVIADKVSTTLATTLLPDRDDAYYISNPINSKTATRTGAAICGSPGIETKLNDGSTAVWMQNPGDQLKAGELTQLRFEILGPDRKPALLEPYMGMMAHAVILKDDGSVYIHLHPPGSFSMGSQKAMLDRLAQHTAWDKYLPSSTAFADSINRFMTKLDAMGETERNELLMADMPHKATGDTGHKAHQISFPYTFPNPASTVYGYRPNATVSF